jgi:hypothetical protein
MNTSFSRDVRRRLAAEAKALSVRLSRTAMDYDREGRVVLVADARAQAVLCRAFERMLRAGGEPQLLQLTEDAAAAFPRGGNAPDTRASAWLAVGLDRPGMATYALRWLDVSDCSPLERRALAEMALFAELAVECARTGFPVAGHA